MAGSGETAPEVSREYDKGLYIEVSRIFLRSIKALGVPMPVVKGRDTKVIIDLFRDDFETAKHDGRVVTAPTASQSARLTLHPDGQFDVDGGLCGYRLYSVRPSGELAFTEGHVKPAYMARQIIEEFLGEQPDDDPGIEVRISEKLTLDGVEGAETTES
jgi:hypothetical protein